MAGLFDFLMLGLEGDKLPAKSPKGKPSVVNTLEGEYVPREGSVGRPNGIAGLLEADPISTQDGARRGEYQQRPQGVESTRPRIGVDPISTQQQSRTGYGRPSTTYYANKAGDIGTSVPRGSGTSGIYEDVAKSAGKVGGGILRSASKVAGPLGFAFEAVNPQMLDDGELTREQQAQQARMAVENMGPQVAGDAAQFGSDLAQRTLDAGMGRKQPLDLRDPQAPKTNLYDHSQSPREEAPVQQTPVGPITESAPSTPQQAAATTAQQYEGERQVVEANTLKGLESGQVSRPKAAEAVVQADAQRAGKVLTPEQTKAAVAEELTSMKSMDNSEVSKYLSYALIAGGLIGSFADKTGRTSELFAQGFNKQLDRNLAEGQALKKYQMAQAKMEQEKAIEERKLGQGDRRLDQGDVKLDQDLDIAQGRQAVAEGGLALGYDRLAETRSNNAANQGLGAARLNQGAARMAQDAEQYQGLMGLKQEQLELQRGNVESQIQRRGDQTRQGDEKTLIAAKKAAASVTKGLDVSTNDAEALVKSVASAQGRNLGKAAMASLAQQIRNAAKNNPTAFAQDPAGVATGLMSNQANYKEKPGGFFTDPTIDIIE